MTNAERDAWLSDAEVIYIYSPGIDENVLLNSETWPRRALVSDVCLYDLYFGMYRGAGIDSIVPCTALEIYERAFLGKPSYVYFRFQNAQAFYKIVGWNNGMRCYLFELVSGIKREFPAVPTQSSGAIYSAEYEA